MRGSSLEVAKIAFSSVKEVQNILSKRLFLWKKYDIGLVSFSKVLSQQLLDLVCCENVLLLFFSRLYFVFLLMCLKTMNRWRMF